MWQTYVTGPPPADPVLETAEGQAQRRAIAADNRRKLLKIIFYRDYEDYDLNEWPFVHRFALYIRNDVLNEVWDYQSGPIQLTSPAGSLDPYEGKRVELNALQTWGDAGTGNGQFTTPRGLAVAPNGNIYVADAGNHRIQVFDPAGQFLFSWGNGQGSNNGQFNEPWGIAVGPDGTVYVADTWNHRIQIFDAEGTFIKSIGTFVNVQSAPETETGNFWGPRDIAVDPQGNFYVTDTGNKRVQKFDADGNFLQTFGGGGIVAGSFEEPVGIDIDSEGNIYVADLRCMVVGGRAGFRPVAVYARRARDPLTPELDDARESWGMLGTNLSYKKDDGSWGTETERLMLMDGRDFNRLGIGLDDLIEGYLQTVMSMIAIDEMADQLITKAKRFRKRLFGSLNDDETLGEEIYT